MKTNSVKSNPVVKRLYGIYHGMLQRCYNQNNNAYKWYGEKGIKVCDEWVGIGGFRRFENWAYKNGYAENLSIDRIDFCGNYEPNNCRWADSKQQANNKSTTLFVDYNGEKIPLSYLCEMFNIPHERLYYRIQSGMSISEAIRKPTLKEYKYNGENHSIKEWSEITGISEKIIRSRIFKGWSMEKVLNKAYKPISETLIIYSGNEYTVKEFAKKKNMTVSQVYYRISKGILNVRK